MTVQVCRFIDQFQLDIEELTRHIQYHNKKIQMRTL